MIVSKPKTNTLFSIGLFLIIAFGLFTYGLIEIKNTQNRIWWYVLIYTSGPIGLLVLMKILMGIKILKIEKEKFSIRLPFKFQNEVFNGKELESWNHTAIKTYGGIYEELTLKLKSGKQYSFSKQENTEYDKALGYMKKKFKKIQN